MPFSLSKMSLSYTEESNVVKKAISLTTLEAQT